MPFVPIPGHEGKYSVNEDGEIISLRTGKLLNPIMKPNGYLRVCLGFPNGGRKDYLVHRIVCRVFHGEPPDGKRCVNHINCDKSDNRASNLEWCDHTENMAHASVHGLLEPQSNHARKLNVSRRKPVDAYTPDGKLVLHFESMSAAIKAGYTALWNYFKNGGRSLSGGFHWEFA